MSFYIIKSTAPNMASELGGDKCCGHVMSVTWYEWWIEHLPFLRENMMMVSLVQSCQSKRLHCSTWHKVAYRWHGVHGYQTINASFTLSQFHQQSSRQDLALSSKGAVTLRPCDTSRYHMSEPGSTSEFTYHYSSYTIVYRTYLFCHSLHR